MAEILPIRRKTLSNQSYKDPYVHVASGVVVTFMSVKRRIISKV